MTAKQKAQFEAAQVLRQHGLLVKGRILYIKKLTDAAVAAGVVDAANDYTGKIHRISERPAKGARIWDGPEKRLGVVRFTNGQKATRTRQRVEIESNAQQAFPIQLRIGETIQGLSLAEARELIDGLINATETVAGENE